MVLGGRFPVNRTFRNGDHYQGDCLEGNAKDGQGTLTWACGDIYEGQWSKDRRHGQGRFFNAAENSEYIGSWVNDYRHGPGELKKGDGGTIRGDWNSDELQSGSCVFPNGTRYEGSFGNFEMPNGEGRLLRPNATDFRGQFLNGKYHGEGTLLFLDSTSDIRSFVGFFQNGEPQGTGQITYRNGDDFEGAIATGFVRHGNGRQRHKSTGETYTGEWRHDLRQGRGTSSMPGDRKYVGEWLEGRRHGYGTQQEGDKWTYEGPWEYDCRHGPGGILKTSRGDVFAGEWHKDHLEGEGKHTNKQSGQSYSGQFRQGRRHGNGEAHFQNDDRYGGEWVDGSIHGEGTLHRVRPPSMYQGTLVDGEFHGAGRLEIFEEEIYEGQFVRGRQQGSGKRSCLRTGDVYVGQWDAGLRHGQGQHRSADGSTQYEGEWEMDIYHGSGRLQTPEFIHAGSWKAGKRHGPGTCDWTSGERYEGQWQQDAHHGEGTFSAKPAKGLETGESFKGQWVQGRREGQGTWVDGKGSTFTGQFSNGQLNGKGEVTLPSKDRYSGEWSLGKKHGNGVFYFWDGARIEGHWENDQLAGEGTHITAMGEKTTRSYGHNSQVLAARPDATLHSPTSALENPDDRALPVSRNRGQMPPATPPRRGSLAGQRGRQGYNQGLEASSGQPSQARGQQDSVHDPRYNYADEHLERDIADYSEGHVLETQARRRGLQSGSRSPPSEEVQQKASDRGSRRWSRTIAGDSNIQVPASPSSELQNLTSTSRSAQRGDLSEGSQEEDPAEMTEAMVRRFADHDNLMELARGLAADNFRLQRELAEAKSTIAALRTELSNSRGQDQQVDLEE